MDLRRIRPDRLPGARLDREMERGGEAHRPQESETVLAKTSCRIANGANSAGLQVGSSSDFVGTKSGDLEFVTVFEHHNNPEMRSDGYRAREKSLDLLGTGAGGDVVVLRRDTKQGIANAATGIKRLVACAA